MKNDMFFFILFDIMTARPTAFNKSLSKKRLQQITMILAGDLVVLCLPRDDAVCVGWPLNLWFNPRAEVCCVWPELVIHNKRADWTLLSHCSDTI